MSGTLVAEESEAEATDGVEAAEMVSDLQWDEEEREAD